MSTMNNVIGVNTAEMIDFAIRYYIGCYEANKNFADADPIMAWGAPGIGKSQGIAQIAETVANKLNKKLHFVDFRLSMKSLVDVGGIPYADKEKQLTKWLRPEVFSLDASDDVLNFIVMEELPTAPAGVQTAALQILLDKQVGEHKLPGNCVLMATGNRSEDRGSFNRLGFALCDRLLHMEVTADFEAWKNWAYQHGIDERILAFLSFRPSGFSSYDPTADTVAFSTPRSWAKASNLLKAFGKNIPIESDYIRTGMASCVGQAMAIEFVNYCKCYKALPDIDAIVAGKKVTMPMDQPDVVYATCTALSHRAIQAIREDKTSTKTVNNIINFSLDFKQANLPECAVMLLRDIVRGEAEKSKLVILQTKAYDRWIDEFGDVFSAA